MASLKNDLASGAEQGAAWTGPLAFVGGPTGAVAGGLAHFFGGGGGGGGGRKAQSTGNAHDNSVARTSYIEQIMGLAGNEHAHHLARQQIDAYNQAQNAHKMGWGPDPGDITTWLTGRGVVPQQGQANDPLNPVSRNAFFEKVYGPWMQQMAGQNQKDLAANGQQLQQALASSGKNLPPGYANLFNLGAKQMTADAGAVSGAGSMLAAIMSNPMAAQAQQQLQADTAARNKAYLEQHMALSNALAGSTGGGLGGLTLPQATVPKTG